jgi:hypothetical protein
MALIFRSGKNTLVSGNGHVRGPLLQGYPCCKCILLVCRVADLVHSVKQLRARVILYMFTSWCSAQDVMTESKGAVHAIEENVSKSHHRRGESHVASAVCRMLGGDMGLAKRVSLALNVLACMSFFKSQYRRPHL